MDHYAGIDVSLEQSSVCVVDATGKIMREAKVASEPDALVRFFADLGYPVVRIGLEAGPLSQWLHAGLSEAGFATVLLETRHVKAALSAMVVKTDRKDARGIAQLLRMGWFRSVHRKSADAQEVRALLVGRKLLQSKLRDVEFSIRGLLRGFGLKVGEVSKGRFAARVEELIEGHAMLEEVVGAMLTAQLRQLRIEKDRTQQALVSALRRNEAELAERVAERTALRRQSGGRAMVMVLCAVCVFAILAGFAWAAAREIAPATFLATSQIKADGRGRALNAGELAEWSNFHTGLLEDPRFHETAADRFKKAGMMSLGTPSAVAEMIRNDLTTQIINPGVLNIHLRGKGSNRTQLALETFTAAYVSHANAARQQRLDGSVTEVSQPATAGLDPLDNTRTIYALSMLGGGVFVAGTLWIFLWRRLAGAKTAFESDAQIAFALDDAKWNNFASLGAAAQVADAKARSGRE